MTLINSIPVPISAARHTSGWRAVFFLFLLFPLVLPLAGCAILGERISPEQLPLGTGVTQVYLIKTEGGWDVVSRIVSNGDSGRFGQRCANAKQLKINPTLVANIIPVRAFCGSAALTNPESKFLDVTTRYYAAAVSDSPVLHELYADLGPIEFDWYMMEDGLEFALEMHSMMKPTVAPRLSTKVTLPGPLADDKVKQINSGLAVAATTHEYFHTLVKRQAFVFESPSVEETVAYLLSHATSIEFGLSYAPTPEAYLEKPLDTVWEEAKSPKLDAFDSSIAGLRLAFAMVEKARKCPLRIDALRGTARIAYEFVREHKKMSLSDLIRIDTLSCDAREAKGNGGLRFNS